MNLRLNRLSSLFFRSDNDDEDTQQILLLCDAMNVVLSAEQLIDKSLNEVIALQAFEEKKDEDEIMDSPSENGMFSLTVYRVHQ